MLAIGAGGGCLDIFSLVYQFSFLSPSLWETARYRLKYCLNRPLSTKQPTNLRATLGLEHMNTYTILNLKARRILTLFSFFLDMHNLIFEHQ